MADARRQFSGTIGGSISRSAEQKRARSGSFSAELFATQDGQQVGKMKIEHSESRRTTTITDLENQRGATFRGVGTALFRRAEHVGRVLGATQLETTLTAQEAQGFYRHMGMAPDPTMLATMRSAVQQSGQQRTEAQLEAMVPVWRKQL